MMRNLGATLITARRSMFAPHVLHVYPMQDDQLVSNCWNDVLSVSFGMSTMKVRKGPDITMLHDQLLMDL
jgi:hypothetical protein